MFGWTDLFLKFTSVFIAGMETPPNTDEEKLTVDDVNGNTSDTELKDHSSGE